MDVRDAPWSRVADYRKEALEDKLNALGRAGGYRIRYYSMPALGNPPENRKSDRSHSEAMAFYRGHVRRKAGEMEELLNVIERCKTALMCYEADPAQCHRSELAAIMAERYGLTYADLRK